jgi:hypothetical protein
MNEDKIKSFSDKNKLWTRTKTSGLYCLKNYLADGTAKELGDVTALTAGKFIFVKKDQVLISFNKTDQSFIVRTTFILETKLMDGKKICGYYSLDIDNNSNAIDDRLVFK